MGKPCFSYSLKIYAEVETHVEGSLEPKGFPVCPQMLTCGNKCDDTLTKLLIPLLTLTFM